MPLALMFTTRLMLTENASVTNHRFPMTVGLETLTIRATLITQILKEIPGYNHGGIND
jgi:hypothetical protein